MNKEDLILKGLKILIESDYCVGADDWLKEYEKIYEKSNEEPCCEMPERDNGKFDINKTEMGWKNNCEGYVDKDFAKSKQDEVKK